MCRPHSRNHTNCIWKCTLSLLKLLNWLEAVWDSLKSTKTICLRRSSRTSLEWKAKNSNICPECLAPKTLCWKDWWIPWKSTKKSHTARHRENRAKKEKKSWLKGSLEHTRNTTQLSITAKLKKRSLLISLECTKSLTQEGSLQLYENSRLNKGVWSREKWNKRWREKETWSRCRGWGKQRSRAERESRETWASSTNRWTKASRESWVTSW